VTWQAGTTFERFTDRARRVLVLAQEEARLLNHGFIGTEHILLGLLSEGEGLAAKALASLEISLDAVREQVSQTILPAAHTLTGSPPFTPRSKKVLELSLREALQLGHNYIGTEHMLLGLVREGEGVGAQVLIGLGADLATVRQAVIEELAGFPGGAEIREIRRRSPLRVSQPSTSVMPGDSWSVEVVRAGRGPDVFSEAYRRLAELVTTLGGTPDDSRVNVTSVETNEGPGLRLAVPLPPN
jgi:ATP-dependent Clp protease ATP-binding subunit ClpC